MGNESINVNCLAEERVPPLGDVAEAPALTVEGVVPGIAGLEEAEPSRVDIRLHRFWETMALGAGTFLVIHGIMSAVGSDLSYSLRFLSGVEAIIGFVTILVDGWFLKNV